jgi:glutamyl-tRNA synthetase
MKTVRTRFAPSPTGALHLGTVRTALFAWLYAKHNNGKFILRIEDTDQTREVEGAVAKIVETLKWLGLDWDEGPEKAGAFGPYIQSERLNFYKKHAEELITKGKAYRCWCSPERLNSLREEAIKNKKAFKYDRYCLNHPSDVNIPHVVRILIPKNQKVTWNDVIKGEITVDTKDVDDFVGLKSDGFPTYHLANVVDDHLMEITSVIRSDEWLASTPKHILLYESFGWEKPEFAHVPNVLSPEGRSKLSKRHGAKAVLEYRDSGYLQSSLINMMATLGWNDGTDKELFSINELVKVFNLDRVQKSPAILDEKRLQWLNGTYIRQLSDDDLFRLGKDFLPSDAMKFDKEYIEKVMQLAKERLKFFAELPDITSFFFKTPVVNLELISGNKQLKKFESSELVKLLQIARDKLSEIDYDKDSLTKSLNELLEETGQKPGILFSLIRISTTWAHFSPSLVDTLEVLGKDEVLRRIDVSLISVQAL